MKVCIFFILTSCAICFCTVTGQTGGVIKNTFSFYWEQQPGNIAVSPAGVEMTPVLENVYKVYVETASKNIDWDTAWFNNRCYLINEREVTQQAINAGVAKETGKQMIIKPGAGKYLWKLGFTLLDKATPGEPAGHSKIINEAGGSFVIGGKYKGIAFLHNAGIPAQLEAIPSM